MSHQRTTPAQAPWLDRTTTLGAAVVLLALAGICALLGDHVVLGALRLAAGVLTGLGLGAALLALLSGRRARLAPHPRLLVAAGTALATVLALTVPAMLATRVDPLADRAEVSLEPLGEGDTVHSLPAPDSPVLVRRADGTAQVLIDGGVHVVEATEHDVLALSADGKRLVRATG
ncbi:MAG: PQQ-binding-like beta-propeller repeat protein, partial [Brachybacterium sp.]